MKVKKHETVTLDAEMAVTRTESGMDYVQVLPDHPSMGQVVPFSGWGRGQLMQNGTFDFIRKKRMDRACQMLRQGYNVSETAYATGFSDPNYFSKTFKKHLGVNPSEYR